MEGTVSGLHSTVWPRVQSSRPDSTTVQSGALGTATSPGMCPAPALSLGQSNQLDSQATPALAQGSPVCLRPGSVSWDREASAEAGHSGVVLEEAFLRQRGGKKGVDAPQEPISRHEEEVPFHLR